MKLIIQIPCFNEEESLPTTLAALPRQMPGFEEVEWLVIDDGSADRTVEVARSHGVDHILSLFGNHGLAAAFQAGIDASLKLGADVIVNTDADNQYRADDIAQLVAPLLLGKAEIVIGDRQIRQHPEFSPLKKLLQRFGSFVVRRVSGIDVPDATSGFRAYTRDAALHLYVLSSFTYTLETLIGAGKSGVAVCSVPIRVNPKLRESRLMHSMLDYIRRSLWTIVRVYIMHEPTSVLLQLTTLLGVAATALFVRYGVYFLQGDSGHVQSVVLAGTLAGLAAQFAALAVIADLLRANRLLAERTLHRVRQIELATGVPAPLAVAGRPALDGDLLDQLQLHANGNGRLDCDRSGRVVLLPDEADAAGSEREAGAPAEFVDA